MRLPRDIYRRPFFWLAVGIAIFVGLLVACWPREPSYAGKSFSYWLDHLPAVIIWTDSAGHSVLTPWSVELEPDQWLPLRSQAEKAVDALGPQCLSKLCGRLQSRETWATRLRGRLRVWFVKLRLHKPWRLDSPPFRRGQAMTALLQLGSSAKPAVPDLIALAERDKDPEVRAAALHVLEKLSPTNYARIQAGQKRPE